MTISLAAITDTEADDVDDDGDGDDYASLSNTDDDVGADADARTFRYSNFITDFATLKHRQTRKPANAQEAQTQKGEPTSIPFQAVCFTGRLCCGEEATARGALLLRPIGLKSTQ